MERDCQIAHGNSAILKERLFQVSDPFQISVCDKCGVVTTGKKECQVCKGDAVSSCNFPYASKLLHQELSAMCLKATIRIEEK
jgi:DNA-directed RNA polymerase II subunit RPB2